MSEPRLISPFRAEREGKVVGFTDASTKLLGRRCACSNSSQGFVGYGAMLPPLSTYVATRGLQRKEM